MSPDVIFIVDDTSIIPSGPDSTTRELSRNPSTRRGASPLLLLGIQHLPACSRECSCPELGLPEEPLPLALRRTDPPCLFGCPLLMTLSSRPHWLPGRCSRLLGHHLGQHNKPMDLPQAAPHPCCAPEHGRPCGRGRRP